MKLLLLAVAALVVLLAYGAVWGLSYFIEHDTDNCLNVAASDEVEP